MPFERGQRVDRFVLEEPLGRGGQGEVWRVRDPLAGGERRALKLISIRDAPPWAVERARSEARALAELHHPSVVPCLGLFEDYSSGALGLVLDYADGLPLDRWLAERRPPREAVRWALVQVAHALAHVHARGILHRDLKPANVVVTRAFEADPGAPGGVKLIDFGIALRVAGGTRLTAVGHVIGTAAFLAPEVLGGDEPTAASDVFAFGVLAHEALFGAHPTGCRRGARLADYAAAYAAPARWLERIARGGDGEWLRACLITNPAHRLPDGQALASAITATAATPPAPRVRPPLAPDRRAKPTPQRRGTPWLLALVAGAIVLASAAAIGLLLWAADFERSAGASTSPAPTEVGVSSPPGLRTLTPAHLPAGCDAARPCGCCPSGHGCLGGECSAALAPDARFALRAGGAGRGRDPATHVPVHRLVPGGRLCLRRSATGARACIGVEETLPGRRASARLDITMADLWSHGIDVEVEDPSGVIVARRARATVTANRRGVLCQGALITGLQGPVTIDLVSLFLDDPTEPPPAQCPGAP
ncbi:MAG: serine/threonine protein kinase [Polyangiaceae bacterium]|nr:serine/threonine protein kinase [Polyangiaceae bacterium]